MNPERIVVAGIMLVCALPVHAFDRLPPEVKRFIERREACDHFRGEIPDPDERQRFNEVLKQIDLSCTGTDRALARLTKKYRRNAAVRKRLGTLERRIESPKSANYFSAYPVRVKRFYGPQARSNYTA